MSNDKYIWLKTTGRLNHRQDGTSELFGISINITEQIETERNQKAKIEESLVFTNFFLDMYLSAYYVNLVTFACRVYKRTERLEREYPIVTDYLDSITDYINKDVHPEDRKALFNVVQPDRMKSLLAEKVQYTHIFRDMSGGKEKIYRMQVIRGSDKNHAAFGFTDITNEVNEQNERQKEAEESKKLIESIATTYNLAYIVNINTDSFKLLCADKNSVGYGKTFTTFKEAKEFFISILPEADRENMRHELDYDTIRKNSKKKILMMWNTVFRLIIQFSGIL